MSPTPWLLFPFGLLFSFQVEVSDSLPRSSDVCLCPHPRGSNNAHTVYASLFTHLPEQHRSAHCLPGPLATSFTLPSRSGPHHSAAYHITNWTRTWSGGWATFQEKLQKERNIHLGLGSHHPHCPGLGPLIERKSLKRKGKGIRLGWMNPPHHLALFHMYSVVCWQHTASSLLL